MAGCVEHDAGLHVGRAVPHEEAGEPLHQLPGVLHQPQECVGGAQECLSTAVVRDQGVLSQIHHQGMNQSQLTNQMLTNHNARMPPTIRLSCLKSLRLWISL